MYAPSVINQNIGFTKSIGCGATSGPPPVTYRAAGKLGCSAIYQRNPMNTEKAEVRAGRSYFEALRDDGAASQSPAPTARPFSVGTMWPSPLLPHQSRTMVRSSSVSRFLQHNVITNAMKRSCSAQRISLSSSATKCDTRQEDEKKQCDITNPSSFSDQLDSSLCSTTEILPESCNSESCSTNPAADEELAVSFPSSLKQWTELGQKTVNATRLLTTEQALKLMDDCPDCLVISILENAKKRISGSVALTFGTLLVASDRSETGSPSPVFATRDVNSVILVACSNGTIAPIAALVLRAYGWRNVFALCGGLVAWKASDLPVEEVKPRRTRQPTIDALPARDRMRVVASLRDEREQDHAPHAVR